MLCGKQKRHERIQTDEVVRQEEGQATRRPLDHGRRSSRCADLADPAVRRGQHHLRPDRRSFGGPSSQASVC